MQRDRRGSQNHTKFRTSYKYRPRSSSRGWRCPPTVVTANSPHCLWCSAGPAGRGTDSLVKFRFISMRHVRLERDINIAINGCSGSTTSTQKGPFKVMLISRSRVTYLITLHRYSSACGRCWVCFVLNPVSMHGPKPKHTKLLPQADE